MGHYGPIVIDPAGADPVAFDREYCVVLSDWSFLHPHEIFRKLKQQAGYFNHQKQTLAGLLAGEDQTLAERLAWGRMRMDPDRRLRRHGLPRTRSSSTATARATTGPRCSGPASASDCAS